MSYSSKLRSPTLDYSFFITDVGLLQHISPDNILCNITEESIACYEETSKA